MWDKIITSAFIAGLFSSVFCILYYIATVFGIFQMAFVLFVGLTIAGTSFFNFLDRISSSDEGENK